MPNQRSPFSLRSVLARLHLHGIWHVHGTLGAAGNSYDLPVFGIVCDYTGAGPIEVPAIFDSDDGIGTGNDAAQAETSILIALVSAEQVAMRLRIFGYQHYHCPGCGLACALGESFFIQCTGDHRE